MLLFRLKEYQKTELPIAAWLESPDRLYQKQHVHDCYEMVLVCRGTGWCAVNGRRFPMLRGDLYMLRPGDLHEFTNNPGMRFYNVMFSDGMLSAAELKIFKQVLDEYGKYTFSAAVFDRLSSLLAELSSELQFSRPGQNLAVKSLFLRFLLELAVVLGFSPTIEDLAPFAGENYGVVKRFLESGPAESMLIPMNGSQRNTVASLLLDYIGYHTESRLDIRSLGILRELYK